MGRARIATSAVVFEQVDPGTVPANALYSDSGNSGALTTKTPADTPAPIATATDHFTKLAKNMSGSTIPMHKSVSKKADGSIVLADSDEADGMQPIGVTLEAIADDSFGRIGLVGRNLPGALTGLGFAAGDDIYLSESAGFTNDPESFTGNDDKIILMGIADCADNDMDPTAVDLIMFRRDLVSP